MERWARIRTLNGEALTGVVTGDMFQPRAGLGSSRIIRPDMPLADMHWLPPCEPRNFICLWNNFRQAAARNGWQEPNHPLYFLKPSGALSGPGSVVRLPAHAGRVVFEGELGIVIGKPCSRAGLDEAAEAVFGYTCVNDLTAVDLLNEDKSFPQWTRAKGFDGFGAIGPVIATGLDWQSLTIRVEVNGRERQNYPAADMMMTPAEIVSRISMDMTLQPGDVIACGTSLGSRPVKAGDEVVVIIDKIGSLSLRLESD